MHNRLAIILAVSFVIFVSVVVFFFSFRSLRPDDRNGAFDQIPTVGQNPLRVDFSDKLPDDFPSDIPVEQEADFDQSYRLDYPEQKQLTVVFRSVKTLEENQFLYADFFRRNGWIISNRYDIENISAIYAAKGRVELNVSIISLAEGKSQISLSAFISDMANVPAAEVPVDPELRKRSDEALADILKNPKFKDVLVPGAIVSRDAASDFFDEVSKKNPEFENILRKAMIDADKK